ncbi:MAG: hypothetical protein EZS28_033025, partial [Streblomastix strix]
MDEDYKELINAQCQVLTEIGHGNFGRVFLVNAAGLQQVGAKVIDHFNNREWEAAGILH